MSQNLVRLPDGNLAQYRNVYQLSCITIVHNWKMPTHTLIVCPTYNTLLRTVQ